MKVTSPLCLVVIALGTLVLLCSTTHGAQLRTARHLEEEAEAPKKKKKKKFFCASNGETYKKKFRLVEDGHTVECKKKCPCPKKKKKFCASNGRTFVKRAKLVAANLTVACRGKCPCDDDAGGDVSAGTVDEDCMCTAEVIPVCASDPMETDPAFSKPRTFDNKCKADCAGFTMTECDGTCPCQEVGGDVEDGCMCSEEMEPVCAGHPMDGTAKPQTFSNQCKANCAGFTLINCQGTCPCDGAMVGGADCDCAEVAEAPICVQPGTMEEATYKNFCEALCVGVDTNGACKGKCPCPAAEGCVCSGEYKPVCVASGTASQRTYPNACEAGCAGASVIDCDGECPCPSPSTTPVSTCECPITTAQSSYCGVDGNTYSSVCEMDCAETTIACKGACPCVSGGGGSAPRDCFCADYIDYVCSTTGNTHSNFCEASCADETVACKGECPCAT